MATSTEFSLDEAVALLSRTPAGGASALVPPTATVLRRSLIDTRMTPLGAAPEATMEEVDLPYPARITNDLPFI